MKTKLLGLLLLTGCASGPKTKDLQAYSAGHVGCDAEQITVANWQAGMGYSNWDAECKGKQFKCSASIGGSSCKERLQ